MLARFLVIVPRLVVLGALSLSLPAWADALPNPVLQALKAAQIPPQSVAVVVQGVDARSPLISHQAQSTMNPASVMKLLTTYAALDLLGPSWTWQTTAWSDGEVVEGRLAAPLYLKGGGDPKFAQEHLWALLRQLRVRGIQHLAGDLVLDRTAFALPAHDPGVIDDKPMRPYNVGPDALLVNFRALQFTLVSDPVQPRLWLETPTDGLRVDNRLQSQGQDCGSDWKDRLQIRLLPDNGGQRLEFTGSFSPACGEKSFSLAPLTADSQLAGLFRALWQELGGSFTGQVRSGPTPASARLLARQESSPLADQVRDINKYSNNVMARQLYLGLSFAQGNGPATLEASRQTLDTWLARRQLRFPELVVENGAGLSRRERLSADSLNHLLRDAWRSPVMPEFIASLPLAGLDGTMKRRLVDSPAMGRAHIKTGTLEGVKTAAGYVLDADGRRYTIVFLINHPRAQAGQAAIDALLRWLAQRGAA